MTLSLMRLSWRHWCLGDSESTGTQQGDGGGRGENFLLHFDVPIGCDIGLLPYAEPRRFSGG
jgi:hypothetical protein